MSNRQLFRRQKQIKIIENKDIENGQADQPVFSHQKSNEQWCHNFALIYLLSPDLRGILIPPIFLGGGRERKHSLTLFLNYSQY